MKIKDSNAREYMNHINTLAQIAGVSEYEGMLIYRKLRRIELKANRLAVMECNGLPENYKEGAAKQHTNNEKAVLKLLPGLQGFFVNGDCRGYTLKVYEQQAREFYPNLHKDWGGYGILAPEF